MRWADQATGPPTTGAFLDGGALTEWAYEDMPGADLDLRSTPFKRGKFCRGEERLVRVSEEEISTTRPISYPETWWELGGGLREGRKPGFQKRCCPGKSRASPS